MPDFITALNALSQQNTLGKMVEAASAEALARKTQLVGEVVQKTNQELSLLDDTLKSTSERIAEVNKNPQVVEGLASVEAQARTFQEIQTRVLEKQKQLDLVYGKSMMALSAIGTEEAMRAAGVLDKNRLASMQRLAQEGAIPKEVAEYEEVRLKTAVSKEQLQDYLTLRRKNEAIQQIEDFISTHPTFVGMQTFGEEVYSGTKYGNKKMEEFKANVATLTESVKAQFGGKVPDGAIMTAINKMIRDEGKNLTVKQVNPAQWAKASGEGYGKDALQQEANLYLSLMQSFTDTWNTMDPALKRASQEYESTGRLPEDEGTKKRVEELHELYAQVELADSQLRAIAPGYSSFRNPANGESFLEMKEQNGLPYWVLKDQYKNLPYGSILRFDRITDLWAKDPLGNYKEKTFYNPQTGREYLKNVSNKMAIAHREDASFDYVLSGAARIGAISNSPLPLNTAVANWMSNFFVDKAVDKTMKNISKSERERVTAGKMVMESTYKQKK